MPFPCANVWAGMCSRDFMRRMDLSANTFYCPIAVCVSMRYATASPNRPLLEYALWRTEMPLRAIRVFQLEIIPLKKRHRAFSVPFIISNHIILVIFLKSQKQIYSKHRIKTNSSEYAETFYDTKIVFGNYSLSNSTYKHHNKCYT